MENENWTNKFEYISTNFITKANKQFTDII